MPKRGIYGAMKKKTSSISFTFFSASLFIGATALSVINFGWLWTLVLIGITGIIATLMAAVDSEGD